MAQSLGLNDDEESNDGKSNTSSNSSKDTSDEFDDEMAADLEDQLLS